MSLYPHPSGGVGVRGCRGGGGGRGGQAEQATISCPCPYHFPSEEK